jgi:transposase-like protein
MGKRGPRPRFSNVACPNEECEDYGRTRLGNVVGNGTYQTNDGRVRKYICRTCGKTFCDRSNTIFYDLRTSENTVFTALRLILKGGSKRATAGYFNVCPKSVNTWLSRAVDHSESRIGIRWREDEKEFRIPLDDLSLAEQKKLQKMKKIKKQGT